MGIVRQCRKCGEDVRPYDLAERPLCESCIGELEARVKELEAERDEARREVCFLEETVVSEQGYSEDAQELATARGWSYLFIGKKE